MRIVRYETGDSKKPKYGWLLGDKVGEIGGNVFGRYRRKEAEMPLAEVKLVAPSEPSKIICVGRNYVEHARELGNEVPKVPLIFFKPPSSVISNGDTVILPPQSAQVEHEGELVVVIGKRGRSITAENAKKYILGYTIGNDVTARDLQKSDGQWTRAKGFDTFCSFGPWIDTEFDPADAVLTCRVNGEVMQDGNTRDMIFDIPTIIESLSAGLTLEPGDIISTGTPSGVGFARVPPVFLKPGDKVEGEVEGVGTLAVEVVGAS